MFATRKSRDSNPGSTTFFYRRAFEHAYRDIGILNVFVKVIPLTEAIRFGTRIEGFLRFPIPTLARVI